MSGGELTHFDANGEAVMVEVGGKSETPRTAVAEGTIEVGAACYERIVSGQIAKGDVLGVARIAGIMAAKRTDELIPLCHRLLLTGVEISFVPDAERHRICARCTARTVGRTGVEMEALIGVQIALLTVYDMCKAIDRGMFITDVHLCEKSGGKSGDYHHAGPV